MISMEMSIRWVRSGRGVLAWLLKELEYKRRHTQYEWEEYEWYYACYCDGWDELICHIDDNNWYNEWKESKSDKSEWKWDNPEYCSEDEIDDGEYNCKEERWYISVSESHASDRIGLYKKIYCSCSDKKVYDIAHRRYWVEGIWFLK